ncbi:hypothetical protein HU200_027364 [Digitaria exilis]|uniref:Cytochrome P450 n=1 Tax=Digitaria exilis TaxID=1010633 RepID=A0A835C580_9POAL|nr:hypothetical protein HU200_027364 [Digitaria exilis]
MFLDRPTGAVVSDVFTRHRNCNIASSLYGSYWRAARRNMATGVLHASSLRTFHWTRARALKSSGAPILDSLHFAMYCILFEMCFGEDVVSKLGEARLRAMEKLPGDVLAAFRSFEVFLRYPRAGRFLYPSRWRHLLAFRRQQEETYLPLEWALANLVKYPELQQKLRQDVVDACGGERDVIEEAELSRMPYVKAFVLETLRRHPPHTAINASATRRARRPQRRSVWPPAACRTAARR